MANLRNYILPFKIIFLNQIALPTTSNLLLQNPIRSPFPRERDSIHHRSRARQLHNPRDEVSPAYNPHLLFISQVSWMRKRDMHILSAGILMYTSDLRFQVIHPDKSENWTLQIKSPQDRDSGVYECQVSTEPKMSLNYTLNVVGEWSIVNNSCSSTFSIHPPKILHPRYSIEGEGWSFETASSSRNRGLRLEFLTPDL